MTTLYIDLETLPDNAEVGMSDHVAPGWTPSPVTLERRTVPGNYSDPTKIATWQSREDLRYAAAIVEAQETDRIEARKAWEKRSLSPMTGRIACISYALDDGPVQVIECSEDEKGGLRELRLFLGRPDRIVAHNGHGFDYEYIWKRAVKHGYPGLARQFRQPKPWDERLADTLLMWRMRRGGSLDAICQFLGISRAKSNIDGSGVLAAYTEGRWSEVVEHAAADIEDLRAVYRRILEAS